jgi:hypothetical protein
MPSRLLRWFASLLVALLLGAPVAAQNPNPAAPGRPEAAAPVLEYTLAFIATAGVLVLVCMPARRS